VPACSAFDAKSTFDDASRRSSFQAIAATRDGFRTHPARLPLL
jgi:hypothetical protein